MKRLLYILFLLVATTHGSAQNIALSKADNLYRLYAYSDAVESYEKLLQRSPGNEYLVQQIAYCYGKMGNYQKALQFYELHLKSKRARYEDFYQYALLLLTDGQFDRAVAEFEKCKLMNPNDQRPADQIERIRSFDLLNLLNLVDTVYHLNLNTRFADMSPAFFKDSIAFVSARDSAGRTYSWNNQPFLDIYQFGTDDYGKRVIQKMQGINTKYHEGPLTFTNNDETIWFTRNNQKVKKRADGLETNNLRIYISDCDGKKWGKVKEFQHNSNEYSVGHPAFSPDGNTLYFASNMEGTYGETDLFKVKKIEKENSKGELVTEWSEPINLGPQFNTTGKEMFPFVDARGVIFFASDGHIGFGGLDIFAAFPVADSFNVMNLGQPINSTYDDFGFIASNDFSNGYFTSNRPGGAGSDDIYAFNIGLQKLFLNARTLQGSKPIANATLSYTVDGVKSEYGTTNQNGLIELNIDFRKNYYFEFYHPNYLSNSDSLKAFDIFKIFDHSKTIYLDNASQLQILVVNQENGDPVSDINVILTLENGKQVSFKTDKTGRVSNRIDQPGVIRIKFTKEGYVSQEKEIAINEIGKGNFNTTAVMMPIYEGKTFTLENLYYDVNSSIIRSDAALVLDELLKILMEFPKMKIELSSHTDSQGDAKYNQWLSQRRAQSAVEYLLSKGISKTRMIAIGFGESKLINHCKDEVECSEEEHQINRRTEFKIMEF